MRTGGFLFASLAAPSCRWEHCLKQRQTDRGAGSLAVLYDVRLACECSFVTPFLALFLEGIALDDF